MISEITESLGDVCDDSKKVSILVPYLQVDSLTSVLGKRIEQTLLKAIARHLKVAGNSQHGFTKKKLCFSYLLPTMVRFLVAWIRLAGQSLVMGNNQYIWNPTGDKLTVVSLRDWYWMQYSLMSLLMICRMGWVYSSLLQGGADKFRGAVHTGEASLFRGIWKSCKNGLTKTLWNLIKENVKSHSYLE